jgi:hypothetical protein
MRLLSQDEGSLRIGGIAEVGGLVGRGVVTAGVALCQMGWAVRRGVVGEAMGELGGTGHGPPLILTVPR